MSNPAPTGAPQSSGSSSTSQSSPGSGEQSSGSEGGEGFDFDPRQYLAETKRTRESQKNLSSAFDSHKKEVEPRLKMLDKLEKAFAPEEQSAGPDPIAAIEEQLDYYLEQAMEAKQRGQAIPLTTNLAVRTFQAQIENIKFQQEIREELQKLRGGLDHANNPETPVNQMAYGQIDNFLRSSLDQLFGEEQTSLPTKQRMYQAVTSALVTDLQELQRRAPQQWDMLRRNPAKLQAAVNHALKAHVPPKAMALIEQEQLQNTPMSTGELWAAFREAKQIEDPKKRREVTTRIRQDILLSQMNDMKKRR